MKNLLKTLFLLFSLIAFAQGAWAQTFITDVMTISGNQSQTNGYKTQFQNQGWTVINNDLNAGGGGNNQSGIRTITIYAGTVTALGGKSGTGIGKGRFNNVSEVITIYGGVVTAHGGDNAAGIGGGESRANGIIEIWNGKVKAYGGNEAAGMGGGKNGSQLNPITIHGGDVYASGAGSDTGGNAGAGIGGGDHGNGGEVTINGGTVKVFGKRGSAGIGGGGHGAGGNITINDGEVKTQKIVIE